MKTILLFLLVAIITSIFSNVETALKIVINNPSEKEINLMKRFEEEADKTIEETLDKLKLTEKELDSTPIENIDKLVQLSISRNKSLTNE